MAFIMNAPSVLATNGNFLLELNLKKKKKVFLQKLLYIFYLFIKKDIDWLLWGQSPLDTRYLVVLLEFTVKAVRKTDIGMNVRASRPTL